MSYLSMEGGVRLAGEISLQGSKNAVLPILAAAVLCEGTVILKNCPDISDVRELLYALSFAGVKSSFAEGVLVLDTEQAELYAFGPELTRKTRGGVLLLGAFLGRFHKAGMAYPGGCVIGARPIDLHCKVLREMHVKLSEEEDGVVAEGRPLGGCIRLSYPSVGATENGILAAVRAAGRTQILGAAREPEISELCRFLNAAGARIRGIGTSCLCIEGVSRLHGVEYTVSGDRIAAGTYLEAVAMTGGEVLIRNTEGVCMQGILEWIQATGARFKREPGRLYLKAPKRLQAIRMLKTAPFPAFPTDMQSQTVAMLSVARGETRISETVFESRFGVVPELQKMGAKVRQDGNSVLIQGTECLHGATVTATDLRSGAALVMAGVAAEGNTKVYGYEYIIRGYEDICGTMGLLGAKIVYVEENKQYGE